MHQETKYRFEKLKLVLDKNLQVCLTTAWKISKCGVFSGPYFPAFGLNTGNYGPEKTPYLDTFHAEEKNAPDYLQCDNLHLTNGKVCNIMLFPVL